MFDQPLQGLCLLASLGVGVVTSFSTTFIGAFSFYCKIHDIKFAILTIVKWIVVWCALTLLCIHLQDCHLPKLKLSPLNNSHPSSWHPPFAFFAGNLRTPCESTSRSCCVLFNASLFSVFISVYLTCCHHHPGEPVGSIPGGGLWGAGPDHCGPCWLP